MNNNNIDPQILARGKEFFKSISGEAPSIFDKSWWTGKVMEFAMKNEAFKIQLFRFVDVLPYLNTTASLQRHIKEYFTGADSEIPKVLQWGAGLAGIGGAITGKIVGMTIRSNLEGMARQFIVGEKSKEAIKNLTKIRKNGFAFTVDFLGEATVSEEESEAYAQGYHELLDALAVQQKEWSALTLKDISANPELDWGTTPKINASIKPSALYSQAKPAALEDSVEGILKRLKPIYRKIVNLGGFLCIDMEQLKYREIVLEVFKRLREDPEFKHYPHLSIVLQAYLNDSEKDLEALIAWGKQNNLPFGIRLVKGAYWDYETIMAKQNGWDVPVWTHKPESDICYERMAKRILENHDLIYFACASHNVRTISAVMELAAQLNVPNERYEFQVLYGMGEPVRKGLLKVAGKVRLYCPYGELIPGMAYLVRRLLENTANESFLKQSFVDGAELEALLENPILTLERHKAKEKAKNDAKLKATPNLADANPANAISPFVNDALIDFTVPKNRAAFVEAIAAVRSNAGRTIPLFINGEKLLTETTLPTSNPANPSELIAQVCQAGTNNIDAAILGASNVFDSWRNTSALERANYLFKAAEITRRRIFELSALQVLEVGKQWDQAYHDIGEGIDFLEYYGREMLRLAEPKRMGRAPGELNHLFYQPKGITAVIAPWNFPFAIAIGMASAAIVAGNPVIFKPSSIASAIGWSIAEVFIEAGLPAGVFNYCPGRSSIMGDYLVEHPQISLICFTGSMDVGLHIIEKAAKVQLGQSQCKRVIAEMGGKNAIIIDDDADLDEAILQVVQSAFAYQGQKCSACSRVIIVESIYERFEARLVQAANSIKIGPSEDPINYMGPLADMSLQKNVLEYIKIAETEGRIIVKRDDIPSVGAYVPLTIVTDIKPEHRIAKEEVFAPVLALMRVKDFAEALEVANSTPFALTGAVFSRSPEHLELARKEFRVGNLYLNRGSTGAMVERQPFGGFKMSGVGSKTGCPDYLLQFMDPRCITENTMRRGFAPLEADDDWV